MSTNAIADKVRVNRKRLDLTGKELAEKVGVSSTMIYDIEAGKKKPGLQTLISLAAVFGCKVDDLVR